MLGKLLLGAGVYFGGQKLSEEANNLTGTKGGAFWTGLGSLASAAIGGGLMLQGGANAIAAGVRGVSDKFIKNIGSKKLGLLSAYDKNARRTMGNIRGRQQAIQNRYYNQADALSSRRSGLIDEMSTVHRGAEVNRLKSKLGDNLSGKERKKLKARIANAKRLNYKDSSVESRLPIEANINTQIEAAEGSLSHVERSSASRSRIASKYAKRKASQLSRGMSNFSRNIDTHVRNQYGNAGHKWADKIDSFLPKYGKKAAMWGAKAGATMIGATALGVGAGAAAGFGWGMATSDMTRTRSSMGLDAPLGGSQFYDPVSGGGPRRAGMDPFADNSAGLVQSLHRLR